MATGYDDFLVIRGDPFSAQLTYNPQGHIIEARWRRELRDFLTMSTSTEYMVVRIRFVINRKTWLVLANCGKTFKWSRR